METLTRTLVPVTKSIPPTKVETVEDRIAKSISASLPAEESLGFLAWVKDAKPTSGELREIFAELLEDPASLKSIERGLQWVA